MPFWDRFLKKEKSAKFGFSSGHSAPERDVRGYLSAYGQIYSLFGISLRIATAVSEVRWRLYKGSERSERSQVADHPILTLLDFANEFQTGQEIQELTSLHMDLAGKAYWYLPKNGLGVPGELWTIPPHLMKIVLSKKNRITGYICQAGDEEVPFRKDEIIRFSMPDPMNPYGGIGYVQAAAVELDSEDYAGQWNRNFFYNSARPDATLEYEDKLSDEEFNRLRLQWDTKYGGLHRAHKVAILEGGVKYKQIQVTQKDMDFIQLRKMTRENLLFAFGMPLSVMGISENVNRANAEAGDYAFARWVIKPRLTRIKNKLNEKLLPMYPKAKGVEIDFDEVVPETVEQKKMLAEAGVKAGYMTINEARKLTGLDPVKGGEVFLIPFNMMPTPANEEIAPEEPKPPPVPPPPPAPEEAPKTKGFTEEQKSTYWLDFVAKAIAYERAMIKALQGMFNSQEKEALSNLKEGISAKTPLINQAKAKETFKKLITPILTDELEHAVDDGEDLINPKPPHRAKQVSPEASDWLKTRIGWVAEEVGEQTATLLANQLSMGFDAGESIKEIAERVKGTFDHCTRDRAMRIARTETIMASNEGALWGYESSGIEKAEFYPAPDACEECISLAGIYPLDEAHAMIPVHPNCRCVFLPVI